MAVLGPVVLQPGGRKRRRQRGEEEETPVGEEEGHQAHMVRGEPDGMTEDDELGHGDAGDAEHEGQLVDKLHLQSKNAIKSWPT